MRHPTSTAGDSARSRYFCRPSSSPAPAAARAGICGFADAIRQAGKSFEYHVYEEAGRGFFYDTKPDSYEVRASRDAFARLLTFFLKTLTEWSALSRQAGSQAAAAVKASWTAA